MVKVPLSYSFLERRDARRKFSESLGAGASLAPRTRQRISLGSENDWKFRLRSCQNWKASSLSLEVVVPTSINKYRMRYVGLGRGNLRSHFVFRPCHAPEWLRARFLPVAFLANEEELTGKTFTTSLNTTNPITYVKLIFLRTSPLKSRLQFLCEVHSVSAEKVECSRPAKRFQNAMNWTRVPLQNACFDQRKCLTGLSYLPSQEPHWIYNVREIFLIHCVILVDDLWNRVLD